MARHLRQLFDLDGQVALVTGGSRGLGLQLAEALGEAGAQIMLTSRKAGDLEEAAAELEAKGIATHWFAGDASDPAAVQRVVEATMERLGRIDILVNNAGATWGAPAEDHPLEAWDKVMNLNARSLFSWAMRLVSRRCLRRPWPMVLRLRVWRCVQATSTVPSGSTSTTRHCSSVPMTSAFGNSMGNRHSNTILA